VSLRRSLAVVGIAALVGSPLANAASAQAGAPYHDARLPTPARVRDLVGRMTLEEKFWQLFMIPGDLDDSTHDYSHGVFGLQIAPAALPSKVVESAGSAARRHAERINAIQRYFVEKARLGIPIIPFEETVHGFVREGGTMFPQAIALAATWDTALMARVASAITRETRTRGVRQALSPVINIANDVRWGRVEETYGEDPYLTSVMARAFIAPFERAGRRHDAETLHRERRRGRSGQLSHRSQRPDARGAVLSAVRRRDSRCRRAVGHDRVQLCRWVAGDAESQADQRKAQGRLEVRRLRHL
jgi:beta-glucosidase